MSEAEATCHPPLETRVIFVRYVLFAGVSGLSNLAAQEIVFRILPVATIMASIAVGTGAGFFVKYLLDKPWVFLDEYGGHFAEMRKIAVYGFVGVATTLLFWGIELSFWHVWQTPEAKYAGAVLGLALGNWIKYRLDKQKVFARGRG